MSVARSSPWGTFSSSTRIVMMMASTPSLNASSRDLLIGVPRSALQAREGEAPAMPELDRHVDPGHRKGFEIARRLELAAIRRVEADQHCQRDNPGSCL